MRLLILATLGFLPTILMAQTAVKPQLKKPARQFNSKAYTLEVGLLGASRMADAITTRRLLNNGGLERNPIFGQRPSAARQGAINAGFFVLDVGVLWLTEHSRHRAIRWMGRSWAGLETQQETKFALCNSGLNPHGTAHC